MRKIARKSANSPFVRTTVEDIIRTIPEKNPVLEANALYNYVRLNIRYTGDIDNVETLKTPEYLITEINTMTIGTGDCDDISLLLATLLISAGFRTRFVLATSWWNDSNEPNHIYVEYFNPLKQEWIPLEGIIKDGFHGYSGDFVKKEVYEI